jgi:hypothetical protein
MSQIHKGIFGALAIALMFGAAQLAFGHDLTGGAPGAPVAQGTGINRAAKADRAPVPASPIATRTIALQPDGLDDLGAGPRACAEGSAEPPGAGDEVPR